MWLANVLSEFGVSAFEPGINRGLLVVMHFAFISLFMVLLLLNALLAFRNVHVWALLGVSSCLYAAVLWYSVLWWCKSSCSWIGSFTKHMGRAGGPEQLPRGTFIKGRKSLTKSPPKSLAKSLAKILARNQTDSRLSQSRY
jgi:hypothetical protein